MKSVQPLLPERQVMNVTKVTVIATAMRDGGRMMMISGIREHAETHRFAGALLGVFALILALAAIAFGACNGDDDEEGESDASASELSSSLPTADELGLDERMESEWDDPTDVLVDFLVIGGATKPAEPGAALEDAGFEAAVGRDLGRSDLNVRLLVAQFDSEEGALEARDVLHDEDLKTPCPDACIVTPLEYELDDVPDSVAVHHMPTEVDPPPGQSGVEAHHAEFTIGPRLYVVQVDGKPSPTFSDEFDDLMQTAYESASSGQ